MRGLGPAEPPPPPPFEDVRQITGQLDGSPFEKLRTQPTGRRWALVIAVAPAVAMVVFALSPRHDISHWPMGLFGLALGSMFVASVFAVVLALPRAYQAPASPARRAITFAGLLAALFVPVLIGAMNPELGHASDLTGSAFGCLGFGTVAALPVLLAIHVFRRDTARSMWPTVFSAVAAAIGANLALQTHCAVVDPMHITVSHAALGIIYAGLAWIVVRATT
jgi:hypothetical protein